jgi:hypothetical protein
MAASEATQFRLTTPKYPAAYAAPALTSAHIPTAELTQNAIRWLESMLRDIVGHLPQVSPSR